MTDEKYNEELEEIKEISAPKIDATWNINKKWYEEWSENKSRNRNIDLEVPNTSFYNNFNKNKEKYIFYFILAIGILVRIWDFGNIPAGFNQDEAFAAYEAYSMVNYGIDSAGKVNPCYFISWGSGMNVLESYLAMSFIKMFGLSVVSFRMPQLILSCVSLPVMFLLLKKVFNKKIAFLGMAVLAVSPWHIMISRWGLESNLAPAFLLFGLFFFIKGIEENKHFLLSALFFGLSLYAYATIWVVIPLILVAFIIYMLVTHQKVKALYAVLSIVILFLFALPLILFLLVNNDFMPEIQTAFLTIPKLAQLRDGELALSNIFRPASYKNLIELMITQNDSAIWNSTEKFGLFYKLSVPFYFLGFVSLMRDVFLKKENKKAFILMGLACTFFGALVIYTINVNRVNFLHLFIIMLTAVGIHELYNLFNNRKIVIATVAAGFAVCFIWFSAYYFTDYNNDSSYVFKPQLGEAIEYSQLAANEGVINVDNSIEHSYVLFYAKVPAPDYVATVRYNNYPAAFLDVDGFTNYKFGINFGNLDDTQVYVFQQHQYEYFIGREFEISQFGNFCVAVPNKR